MSSTNFNDDDLDAYAESVAKRTADRESRLQRLAMLKRQQLENDEEELQKSVKKHASSTTNVISTSISSPVKSPQKLSTSVYSYNSPTKNHQFLPSFNSPQRSFAITRSIEKSSSLSPQKKEVPETEYSFTTSLNNSTKTIKTPINSPEKQYLTNCSPKPYQKPSPGPLNHSPIKSPLKSFMCHSPSQGSIASNFQKKVVDFSSSSSTTTTTTTTTVNSLFSASNNTTTNDTTSIASQSACNQSPTKSLYSIDNSETTPNNPSSSQQKQQIGSTSSVSTTALCTNKRSMSPVRLFASAKSSNPIKMVSPIKQQHTSGINTPEKLCVSDKKKLFENAIKEETESAKRVQEQNLFLSRRKLPTNLINQLQNANEPLSMPKRIKTTIFNLENQLKSSTTTPEPQPKTTNNFNNNTVPKTIVDVEMKQTTKDDNDYSIRPGDDISKLIDQVGEETVKFENSLDSIAEEESIAEKHIEEDLSDDDGENQLSKKLVDDLDDLNDENQAMQTSLIKSSTKANLYPNLCNLDEKLEEDRRQMMIEKESTSDNKSVIAKEQQVNHSNEPIITGVIVKSPTKSVNNNFNNDNNNTPTTTNTTSTIKQQQQQQTKTVTPMRTLSQYRREQKQRAIDNSTPSNRVDLEKARKKELEHTRFIIYQTKLKEKYENLKMLIEKYEKAIEQSSNAIALCLKNPDQRNSGSQLAAEQILLISIQRRDACRQEIESIENKIKSTSCRAPEMEVATGCISIERIQIPLKGDFIVGQVSDQDPLNHHFICLARCGEHVLETELLDSANSIQQASIIFDNNKLQFKELDKNFEIHFELYGLALPKEKVHHHHDKRSLLIHSIKIPPLSPKLGGRSKKAAQQMFTTYSANQGFTRLGYVKFDWNNILDRKYEFEDFMPNSPFNGQIEVDFKMNAVYNGEVEMEDFLNIYDGKYWKSRYYVLKGYMLAYWHYKEDYADKNLPSLGTIDLRTCVNRKIGPVSLNVCPRSYSFVLVTEQEQLDTKQNSYKDNKVHKITEQKLHVFAADSKEDFEKWCDHLNKLLPLIRIWECNAHPPQDLKFLEQ